MTREECTDWFEQIISDTIDMDWQPRWAAKALVEALDEDGVLNVIFDDDENGQFGVGA